MANDAWIVDYNNKYFRAHSIVTDAYGIDPLQDRVVPKLMQITSYTSHEVTASERGQPDLVSYEEYGSGDYWWHIMAYNGICRYADIVEGTTLKIPALSAIIQITNDVITSSSASTITI